MWCQIFQQCDRRENQRYEFRHGDPKTKKSTPWQEKNTDYLRPTQGVPKEMPYCCHTDAILMPYLRVWLHYGYTMASVWQVLGKDLASAWEKLEKNLGRSCQAMYT